MDPNRPPASQPEADALPRPGFLLQQVHVLYRSQFRSWFGIMAPTTLMAGVVLLWSDRQVKAMFRTIPLHELLSHRTEMFEAAVLRFGGFFVTWFLGCFALATIASVVNRVDRDDDLGTAWITDRHQRAREHLGAVFVVALITFCAFLAGIALSEFVQSAAIRLVGWSRFARFSYAAAMIGYVTVASVVSWLGAAIPLILRGEARIWASLKRSVEFSSGYEGALSLLVLESVLGGLVAWYATFYTLHALLPSQLRQNAWHVTALSLIAILASAAAEAPLFIGFSLLADPEFHNRSSLPASEQAAYIQQLS